ncbi:MAG: type II secretion system protein GspM [Pseudomonadota bacterium]
MTALAALLADRTPRERRMLVGLAVVAVAAGSIAGVWQPLRAQNAALADSILRHERALAQVLALPAQADVPDARPAPVIVTEAAETFGLQIRRLQPQGSAVQVALDEAAFDAVLLWVEALERDHGLRLADLTLTRRPAPGTVAATLTLEVADAD